MADNNCDMALPLIKTAEWSDARFQKMPLAQMRLGLCSDAALFGAKEGIGEQKKYAKKSIFRVLDF